VFKIFVTVDKHQRFKSFIIQTTSIRLEHIVLPPCPPITWHFVLHGREVSPFYKNLKPINRRPAVFEHNPVADILTQLTAP